jgi:hypothetical protein
MCSPSTRTELGPVGVPKRRHRVQGNLDGARRNAQAWTKAEDRAGEHPDGPRVASLCGGAPRCTFEGGQGAETRR